jgi:hypothetical protein
LLEHGKTLSPPKHYFVATQDNDFHEALDRIPGIPILYLNKVTLVLSNMSRASKAFSSQVKTSFQLCFLVSLSFQAEDVSTSLSNDEEKVLSKINSLSSGKKNVSIISEVEGVSVQSRKKKKAASPNPLSHLTPQEDSVKSKKKKVSRFRKH